VKARSFPSDGGRINQTEAFLARSQMNLRQWIVIVATPAVIGSIGYAIARSLVGNDEAATYGFTAAAAAFAAIGALSLWQRSDHRVLDLEAALVDAGYRVEVHGEHVICESMSGGSNRLGSWNAVSLADWALAERLLHADGDVDAAMTILAYAHDPHAHRGGRERPDRPVSKRRTQGEDL